MRKLLTANNEFQVTNDPQEGKRVGSTAEVGLAVK